MESTVVMFYLLKYPHIVKYSAPKTHMLNKKSISKSVHNRRKLISRHEHCNKMVISPNSESA
jgi:hypothetical protein